MNENLKCCPTECADCKEYREYPYKHIYPVAKEYSYPVEIVDRMYRCAERNIESGSYVSTETLVRSVLIYLHHHYEYSYTNEEEFKIHLNKLIKIKENDNTYNGLIARALRNY